MIDNKYKILIIFVLLTSKIYAQQNRQPGFYGVYGLGSSKYHHGNYISDYKTTEWLISIKTKTLKENNYLSLSLYKYSKDATQLRYSEDCVDPPVNKNQSYTFGGHIYYDKTKFGFSLGLYSYRTDDTEFLGFILPYIQFRYGNLNGNFLSLTLLDLINFLPYTIGYNYINRIGGIKLKLCYLGNNFYATRFVLCYNVFGNKTIIGQYMYYNSNSRRYKILRIGFGYNFSG